MATKTELETETEALKAKTRTERKSEREPAETDTVQPETSVEGWIEGVAAEHGIDAATLKPALEQLAADLENLPRKQPMLAMLLAFGIGFMAGRATK